VADYLFIELSEDASHATWAAFDASGRLLSTIGRGALASVRPAVDGHRVVVLVPATAVIATQAEVPAASASRLRQMLPYSLEEMLAEDVEQLAFAVGRRLASGAVSVAIVAKQNLTAWLDALQAVGVTPNAVYSAADGVPDTPGTLTLMLQGGRLLGRRPGQPAFALEGFGIEQTLDLLRRDGEEMPELKHLVVYADEAGRRAFQAELEHLQDRVASAEVKLMPDGMFPHLAATLAANSGTNLLQGQYAPKSNWAALARPWRLAAGLLLALGVVALLSQGVEYLSLSREDTQLTEQIASGCGQIVAGGRINACEQVVQQRLRDAGGSRSGSGETFLSTLAAIAQSRDAESRIEALSYRNQVMDLQLVASSVPALDEFRRGLGETQRFEAVIESANPTDAGVEGRVKIASVRQ
jgi:general secretion pathway protein L